MIYHHKPRSQHWRIRARTPESNVFSTIVFFEEKRKLTLLLSRSMSRSAFLAPLLLKSLGHPEISSPIFRSHKACLIEEQRNTKVDYTTFLSKEKSVYFKTILKKKLYFLKILNSRDSCLSVLKASSTNRTYLGKGRTLSFNSMVMVVVRLNESGPVSSSTKLGALIIFLHYGCIRSFP